MLMRMLEAGGVEVYSDGERTADRDNPHGYFEHELIKALSKDASWLYEAKGKAIKIIAHLLKYIPKDLPAKILFIERDIEEVLMSQQKMIDRLGTKAPAAKPEVLKQVFAKQVAAIKADLADNSESTAIYLNYRDTIADPTAAVSTVADFLGIDLDLAAMEEAVDSSLYRNRV